MELVGTSDGSGVGVRGTSSPETRKEVYSPSKRMDVGFLLQDVDIDGTTIIT